MASTQIGTPLYMSPEIHEKRPYSSKADVWAIGCVLVELMALEFAWDVREVAVGFTLGFRGGGCGSAASIPLGGPSAMHPSLHNNNTKGPHNRNP